MKKEKNYKAIFVSEEVHYKLKVAASKKRITIGALVELLVKDY